MFRKLLHWVQKYERHLSAFFMFAGFVVDSLFFERVDIWRTHAAFATYAALCFAAIPLLHWLETRAVADAAAYLRTRFTLRFAIQFALGGFWSGLVILYGRSADLGVSWPFLAFLVLILLGSEYFSRYHARLVFTSVLFFFALYSYTIFALPIYTGTLGMLTFLGSGAVAIGLFALFTALLRTLARERFFADLWRIRAGAFAVFLVLNVFYFTNILPPLPLAASAAGVYHSVWRVPGEYLATTEKDESWGVRYLGFAPTLHLAYGEPLSAYSAVFAPTALATTIVHRWQWYDEVEKQWVQRAVITYQIVGGRDGGYRGYSTINPGETGEWRVAVETSDGRLIARLPFTIERVAAPLAEKTITLK